MNSSHEPATTRVILLAEDNPADQNLALRSLRSAGTDKELHIVEDGEEALAYLERRGPYTDEASSPRPDIVLLDINMPRINGQQVLQHMRASEQLRSIPVIMLTVSDNEDDVAMAYASGANAYLVKPVELDRFKKHLKHLKEFWFESCTLPPRQR